jgi:ComF family protein
MPATIEPARSEPTWLRRILDFLFPPHCIACKRMGQWLCASCVADIAPLDLTHCPQCGLRSTRPGICAHCRIHPSFLVGVHSLAAHRSPLRDAVHGLKYEGVRVLAEPLAQLLVEHWFEQELSAEVVVAVPLHLHRERQRGYNQSRLLASDFADKTGLTLVDGVLQRTRATRAQVGLGVEDRWANVHNAFAIRDPVSAQALVGRHVLLIDDVCTTGATLESCAQALLRAGANTVRALTVTRAIGGGDDAYQRSRR